MSPLGGQMARCKIKMAQVPSLLQVYDFELFRFDTLKLTPLGVEEQEEGILCRKERYTAASVVPRFAGVSFDRSFTPLALFFKFPKDEDTKKNEEIRKDDNDYHRNDEQVKICLECCNSQLSQLRKKYIRISSQATVMHVKKFIAKKLRIELNKVGLKCYCSINLIDHVW
ncbi:Polycomb group RING finger protein 3 [Apostichopus japonicus]|uniref:Polycomb group RING finger protein 3 n=1 Tax=Stichopus japonicus TaxID=307972 RepID=A0A2G8KN33_STIJA|nr:Polycomb group RING finger protein 3 [Apostichopus japonicus]